MSDATRLTSRRCVGVRENYLSSYRHYLISITNGTLFSLLGLYKQCIINLQLLFVSIEKCTEQCITYLNEFHKNIIIY